MSKSRDPHKGKYQPPPTELDAQIDEALSGLSLDDLYASGPPESPAPAPGGSKLRRGRVVSVTADELFVDMGGKSQGVAALEQFDEVPKVGDELEFEIERYHASEGLLILKRKGAAATDVSWENLEVGQIVEGTVTGSNKGGLELDIKGMRAFMPAGQVDIYFNPDLAQFIGTRMKAEVTSFSRESRNLILSRRNILEREKEEAKRKLIDEIAEGQIRRGTVRSVMDYGAFVDLGGMDGLLHVSEMSFRRGVKPSELVKVGDVVDVKIVKFDREAGKLSLSLNQARGVDPWMDASMRYATGTQVTGRVTKVEQFGAFIEVEEGVEGLLPVSEISWQRVKHPSDVVRVGDTVRLVVLSVDPAARRMSFSLKQAGPDPWKTVAERYAVDMIVAGTVTRTADFGAFVEVEPGLEGLVHISELADTRVQRTTDIVKPGDAVQVRVLEIDGNARRMALSIRRAHAAQAPSTTSAPATISKKKRPQLRGGLDL